MIKSRADIKTELATALINTAPVGSITPEILLGFLNDIVDSAINIPVDTNLQGLYAFDPTRQYYLNEITYYSGVWYTCNSTPAITGAFDPAKWTAQANNIFKASLTINTADVLTLNTTPLSIVPAVAGKSIQVVSSTIQTIFNSIAYATNTQLRLITDTATISQVDFLTGLNATVSRISQGRLNTAAIGATETQLIQNKALMASVATGNPTDGNSQIIITVFYFLI